MDAPSPSTNPIFGRHIATQVDLYAFLNHCIRQGASDVVLQSGHRAIGFVDGATVHFTSYVMQTGQIKTVLKLITGADSVSAKLAQGKDFDHAFDIPDASEKDRFDEPVKQRFRLNASACHDHGNLGNQLVLRHIPSKPPSLDGIEFPIELRDEIGAGQGAFIIAGETGSGKTTTFAACIRHVLEDKTSLQGNILTYESPIEYIYGGIQSARCVIAQAEIGLHIPSFADGIRNAMRRAPSLIVVGELRDEATIMAAIEAANTGHPIYATTHANSAPLVIRRMVQRYPERAQTQAFGDIIEIARIIMSQTLVPKRGGGRVCLRDWIVITPERAEQLLADGPAGHVTSMRNILASGKQSRSMETSIAIANDAGFLEPDTYDRLLKRYVGRS